MAAMAEIGAAAMAAVAAAADSSSDIEESESATFDKSREYAEFC